MGDVEPIDTEVRRDLAEREVDVEGAGIHVEVNEKELVSEVTKVPKVTIRRITAISESKSDSINKQVPADDNGKRMDAAPIETEVRRDVAEREVEVEGIEVHLEVAGNEVVSEVTKLPKVTFRRITAISEMTSEAPEALKASVAPALSEAPLEARVAFQSSGDPHEAERESAVEELDSATDDETSESQGDLLNESDEEEAGESSNSLGEVSLNDEDVQQLVDQIFKIESEAAEAQEMLEEESLVSVREEVRAELVETLCGLELDASVEEEISTYIEQWEEKLEDLQEQSSLLQEKLEDAGVSLPDLFKGIEKQAPESCSTEAWKQRTHWAGHQPTLEVDFVVKRAEEELKIRRPTRSKRGKLVDEGASGFLERKFAAEVGDDGGVGSSKVESPNDCGWSKVEDFIDNEETPEPGKLMGTKRWAAVYFASTPEQAAQLGLVLPGVDIVEEIGDMESGRGSQFKAALANEKEQGFTDRQKNSIKKVREEDDVKRSRRPQKRARKTFSNRSRVKISLQENQAHLAGVGDTRQLEKPVQQSLVISSNGESLSQKQIADHEAEVIVFLSDDEATEGFSHKDAKYHLAQEDHVKIEENHCCDKGGLVSTGVSADLPGILEEKALVPQVPPVLELNDLNKKRAHEDGFLQSEGDTEILSKRSKFVSVGNEVGLSNGDQKEVQVSPLECSTPVSGSIKDDAMQVGSLNATPLYRTTVVIDSDGEREVEEAVMQTVHFNSSTRKSLLPENIKQFGVLGQGNSKGDGSPSMNTNLVMEHSSISSPGDHLNSRVLNVVRSLSKTSPIGDAKKRKWKSTPEKEPRDFPCTACGTLLRRKEVLRHPRLPVGICKRCTKHYLSGPFRKDEDGSDSECSWCGEGGEVVCCGKCDKVFCQGCIMRNFGAAENLRIVTMDDWLCYFCNPVPLWMFTQQLKQAELQNEGTHGDRRGAGTSAAKTTMGNIDEDASAKTPKKGKHRKNIRKVLGDDELEEKQKELLAREKERQERLEQWRTAAGHKITSNPTRRKAVSKEVSGTSMDDCSELINVARAENEAEVRIAPRLASVLKDHQRKGVRFMWENCIVSEQRVKDGAESFGCILAHSMGLGKTLQVITFIHTVLNRDLGLRTALIVVPVNVLHNWKREFEIWQAGVSRPVSVYMLDESIREGTKRAAFLRQWQTDGGVMLIGYASFRNLSTGRHVRDKATRDELCTALQNPGPDLLVCDEAHTIKNRKADITQVLKEVKTRRRIALTGSPLQNNLMEYYCMVDFVREGFLGSPQVFKNRFQNPIENGQHADSTARDVRLMKQRSHVLHKELTGFVQRMDMSVLKDELPPKCVYVISVRLSPLQRQLYAHYLQVHGLLQEEDEATENKSQRKDLFHAYHALAKVWNHPDLLLLAEEERARKHEDCAADEFIADSDEEKLSDGDVGADGVAKGIARLPSSHRLLKKKGSTELNELEKPLWWKDIIKEDFAREEVELSGKMVLLLRLLTMCSRKGDKALVFSQSLGTLSMIERFLERNSLLEANGTHWQRDKQWYRLDGSTPAAARMHMCERFNDPSNTAVKCVLISTRAGSLGINLPAANRVIIVDGSWNPTHDLQALFRAWRLGQKKPVYAYRLLAHGTMEEKIYSRQVAKEGVAARVLDEQQVGRHFAGDDLEFLFRLEDDGDDFAFEESERSVVVTSGPPLDQGIIGPAGGSVATVSIASTSKSKLLAFTLPVDAPPRDDLMGNILIDYRPRWVVSYHEHEPLLEHREEENLTSDEQKAAWESYKMVEGSGLTLSSSTTVLKTTSTHTSTTVKKFTVQLPNVPGDGMRCSPRDHAAILSERNVNVGNELVCATCLLYISWEKLGGLPEPSQKRILPTEGPLEHHGQ